MYINFEKFNNLFGGRNESKDADVSAYEQSQNEFFNSLEGIKKEYDDKVNSEYQSIYDAYPEDPGYEYVSYTGPTKEQIISDTTSAYQSAFKQEAERLERQFNEDKNALAFGKSESYQKAEQGKADARSESKEEKRQEEMKTYTKYRKTIKVTYLFTTCAIFFAALFFAPVSYVLSMVGVFDIWYDLRKRIKLRGK